MLLPRLLQKESDGWETGICLLCLVLRRQKAIMYIQKKYVCVIKFSIWFSTYAASPHSANSNDYYWLHSHIVSLHLDSIWMRMRMSFLVLLSIPVVRCTLRICTCLYIVLHVDLFSPGLTLYGRIVLFE